MAERRSDWLVKAGQAWAVLVEVAAEKRLTTYKQLGSAIGLHHRAVHHALGIIQSYCLEERLPVLATIVVNASRGRPGGGSVAAGREDIDEMHAEVFSYPWAAIPNPFGQFAAGESLDTFTDEIIRDPDKGSEVYARVRVRGVAHQIFRSAVTKVYNWQCAMCGLSFSAALEAAHIIRWPEATPQQRMDPRNGLLLCATHHKLFDAATITVTDKLRIRYYDPEKIDAVPYSKADSQVSADLHGKKLYLPTNKRHWPDIDWLRQRNTADGWED